MYYRGTNWANISMVDKYGGDTPVSPIHGPIQHRHGSACTTEVTAYFHDHSLPTTESVQGLTRPFHEPDLR